MGAVDRFNRNCRAAAALWLATVVPLSVYFRPSYQDFQAFYMAGVIARLGEWDVLYPEREPGNPYFVYSGFRWKPRQVELARRHGVGWSEPFLQPPWTALAFAPLSRLDYRLAHATWVAVLTGCAYGVAVCAGRGYELAAGRASRGAGVTTLVVALSLLSYRAIRSGNVSVAVALAIALATLRLRQGRDAPAAAAVYAGGVLKYATAALAPLLLVMRRWRAVLWLAGLGAATVLLTLAVTGAAPLRDFAHTVGGTFGGSTPLRANQSVWGLLLRVTGRAPLGAGLQWAVRGGQAVLLGLVVTLMFRRPRAEWGRGPAVFAAAAALVAWLLIFSPVFWEHYAVYLAPFWGWMLWEGRHSPARRVAAIAAVALAWVPLPALLWLHLPEPLNSMMLWSACLTLALGIDRLRRPVVTA